MLLELRPYQVDGLNRIRDQYATGAGSVLYTLPTGGGKTVLFSKIAENAAALGKRVLILVHRRELLRQASGSLLELGVPHGRIAPGHTMNGYHVQVGSVQTVVRRKIMAPDLIIIDEAHHALASSWASILDEHRDARILGVTATPQRLDGKGLGRKAGGYFDVLVEGPSMKKLTEMGYLCKADVYAPDRGGQADMTGVRRVRGDWDPVESEKRVDKPVITGSAIEHYRKYAGGGGGSGGGKPCLAFCVSVKHAQHVAEEFHDAGYRTATIHGKLPVRERDDMLAALAGGYLDVVTACDVLSEGVDVPLATCGILLRPTQSMGLFLQQVGRLLRPHPDKERAVILDHVGNTFQHGLPDEEREWTLESRSKKKRATDEGVPACRQCPMCYRVHNVGPQCPACGYVYSRQERPELEQVEGELRKVEAERLRVENRQRQGMAKSLQELTMIAKQKGYNPGWAYKVWRGRNAVRKGKRKGSKAPPTREGARE